ncbi:MAG: transposase [Thaumarchaeota archaeon]|nr:transposase [Nitrososphaerota archaeon]
MARTRWSSEKKIRILVASLTINIAISDQCRKHSVSPVQFYQWKERFV